MSRSLLRRAWTLARGLRARDWRDLSAAAWSLASAAVVLRVQSPARVIARANEVRAGVVRPDAIDVARLLRLLDVAGRHVVRVLCLPRAVGTARFLTRRGVPAAVRIGVRTVDHKLEAHAWVTVDNVVVNDAAAATASYEVVEPPPQVNDVVLMLLKTDLQIAFERAARCQAVSILNAAERHGVVPLIADRLQMLPAGQRPIWANDWLESARAHLVVDMQREPDLSAALAALERAGAQPILFKGAHLAHRDYARPDLRPRVDSDVLIPHDADAREAAHRALLSLGYETKPQVGGSWLMTQRMYVRRVDGRLRHALDLHWRVANPQAFARVLTHDELWRDAEPLPALGPAARGPNGPHALLIACLHRVAHHANDDCLIWLKDIDLIARRLTTGEWARFRSLATERRVSRVCAESLSRTAAAFATPIPDESFALPATGLRRCREASAAYLSGPRHGVQAAWLDLRASPSWRARLELAGEYVMPPVAYMREVYAPSSRAPLPWLYLKRVLTAGVRRAN